MNTRRLDSASQARFAFAAALLGMAVLAAPFAAAAEPQERQWRMPTSTHYAEDPRGHGIREYEDMGVFKAREKYGDALSWGKGQTLALLDDSCDVTIPEWRVVMPWGPKIIDKWNSVENNDDPAPIPPARHGTTMGFPSSLNYEGRAGIAFNNFLAPVRCTRLVYFKTELDGNEVKAAEMDSIRRGLEWVLANRERLNITAVNLAVLDGGKPPKHETPPTSEIDPLLKRLRDQGVWVSAPCGNSGSATRISWPAVSPYCFAIGASGYKSHHTQRDRNPYTDLLARAGATSSSNAYAAGSAMVLREAIEKTGFDWGAYGPTLPEAMMAIFQKTGVQVKDTETDHPFASLNLLAALDFVFDHAPRKDDEAT